MGNNKNDNNKEEENNMKSKRIYLTLYDSPSGDDITYFVETAQDTREDRRAVLYFAASDIFCQDEDHHQQQQQQQQKFTNKNSKRLFVKTLPVKCSSYVINLASEEYISSSLLHGAVDFFSSADES